MDEIRFKSPEEVREYVKKLAERRWEEDPGAELWRVFKHGARLFILVVAYLQYFIIDLTNQALTLPGTVFNVPSLPATALPAKHGLILVFRFFT